MKIASFRFGAVCTVAFVSLFATPQLFAGTALWSAGAGADTNWSNGANWTGGGGTAGVPGATDNVVFGNVGNATTITAVSNVVDSTGGNFLGTIWSLAYTNNVNGSYQNTVIAPGLTLTITNNTGPFGSALFVGTTVAGGANATVTASVTGNNGAALVVNNTNAVISFSQSGGSGALGILNMTNLDYFTANINLIAIGDFKFGIGSVAAQGILYLAKTNVITTTWIGSHLSPYTTANQPTNSIQLGVGSSGTLGGINAFYLGLTNRILADSIGIAGVKSGGSAAAPCLMAFNPSFTNNNPTAYIRGAGGDSSRIFSWGVGDTAINSGSSAQAWGKVDFSGGSVDILVETLILGRDRNGTGATPDGGIFTFTGGKVNANNVIVGDQGSSSQGSVCQGTLNVFGIAGGTPVLTVNTNLELGHTTVSTGPTNLFTMGLLNISNATVNANTILVGATSTTNNIRMANATLIVTNTLATNASGLFVFAMTNSTLGMKISSDGSRVGLVQTLTTGGAGNTIQLDPNAVVFSTYPKQVQLIKYTGAIGGAGYNFSLASIPVWAPGAYLSNNAANSSVDFVLANDPRPVITIQPPGYSGNPGDNVTFTVGISGSSVTPLSYQWYFVTNSVTNLLADGNGPSGTSTLSGSTTASLSVNNAQPGDSGSYFSVITNLYGSATSSSAILTISAGCVSPSITGPGNQTVIQGNNATFSTSVAGNPAPVIQWQTGGTNIPGATTSTLVVTSVQYPVNDQQVFSIIATNACGNVTNSATLTVIVPPVITSQPSSLVVTNTQSASFAVTATGVPSPAYQWNKNNSAISGATSATYTIASTSPSDTASYSCTITNLAGTTNTVSVSLTVNSLMSATSLSPANSATGVCYDTPLYITFSSAPTVRSGSGVGAIKIYNVTNSATPVDTLDMSQGNPQGHSAFQGDSLGFNYYPVVISGSTAAIYPHSGVMTSNQTYYITIDDGVFMDGAGAYFAGIAATNVWQFTTKPAGPADPTNPVVNIDGTGDFVTVQGALDSLPVINTSRRTINIRNGTYFEIVNISGKSNVTFRGQSRAGTVVKYPNNFNIATGNSTHTRMTFKVNANDVAVENLWITNSTPQGGSQAEALTIESNAKRVIVNNCDISSRQDTILAIGSSQSIVFFNNSRIYGNFDYIWGGGDCFFNNCTIHTIPGASSFNLTAARTDNSGSLSTNTPWVNPNGTTYSANGFSFVNCTLEADAGVTGITLAGNNGTAGGLDSWTFCKIDTNAYVSPSTALSNNYVFWQSQNTAPNGVTPVSFTNVQTIGVTNNDPRLLAATNPVVWFYGWQPQLAPNIINQPGNQSVSQGQSTSFTVGATGIPDPTYQWLKNGSPISGETSATLNINNAVRTNTGNYSVVVSNAAGSVTSSAATLAYTGNVSPVANPSTYTRAAGSPLNVAIAGDLATNWSDADGDPIALSGSISSTNGATVSYDGSYVYYTNLNNVADQINYTIADGQGGTGAGVISVVAATAPNIASPLLDGNGRPALGGQGTPGVVYGVESAPSLTGPWINADTGQITVGNDGSWTFTDTTQTNPGTIFYRLYYPYSVTPPQ